MRDPQGRKAVLGIGFEERSEAFDLSIALQEARRALGWEGEQTKTAAAEQEDKRDYSLKAGETITVSFGSGSKFGRRKASQPDSSSGTSANLQSFALPPPRRVLRPAAAAVASLWLRRRAPRT